MRGAIRKKMEKLKAKENVPNTCGRLIQPKGSNNTSTIRGIMVGGRLRAGNHLYAPKREMLLIIMYFCKCSFIFTFSYQFFNRIFVRITCFSLL